MDAREYAIKCHSDRNQKYHDMPYDYHLRMVNMIAEEYMSGMDISDKDKDEIRAACWVHDVIEDTGQTYNDVKRATNEIIAEYAYALTNEKGRTRKDRANARYYYGIREYKHATFVKLCDRYANMYFSKESGSSMFKTYVKEMDEFRDALYDGRYNELWIALEELSKS